MIYINRITDSVATCGVYCEKTHAHTATKASFSQQIDDFFSKLFSTADFPARWHCGNWTDFHGWLYIVSDLSIWAAYFAIPILLLKLVRKRKDLPFHKIFLLFVAFILLCGTTHLIDAGIFWWPAYRFSALVRFITGLVSIFSVYALNRIIPLAVNIRTVKDLEDEIEKRREVEEKLAASEFLLSEAGRISRVGGWETDLTTHKRTWSNTVYDIFEIPHNIDLDKLELTDYFFGSNLTKAQNALREAIENNTRWDHELQMKTARGNVIWVRSTGEPLLDENGKVVKLRGIFMDIDRYKQTEFALNKSLELTSLNNQQLKNFTHILSHNIRNHASNMALISSLVDTDSLDVNNKELFDKMSNVSAALNDTLEHLSEAIRIKDTVIQREVLNIGIELKKVLDIFQSDLNFNNAKIELQLDVEMISFPRIYLESILTNLISNAIKYRDTQRPLLITIKTYKNDKLETVLECVDNGVGIDLKLHGQKIFGLYKTFHDRKDAHGVGLFLVKTQIESQGGKIEVESIPGSGSTFKIIF
ncbi:PAS domain-containing protein [Mucilaginibacter sp. 21P]|uniref:sensor histidine kinase n=1 Tax=Mucilaginibacter sp. 21P TaxID=2778902 RepID=UPI001C57CFE0|nr:ATP-binding protein [Mucilaginibacter sp. 21P]QXV65382.1 PAS domain-containing protein [Mucilaginibacter sp. 21P]